MFSDDFVSSPECFMYTTEVIGRQSAPDFVFTYGDMPAHHFFICLFTYMCDYADIDYGCLFTLSKDMTADDGHVPVFHILSLFVYEIDSSFFASEEPFTYLSPCGPLF